MGEQKTEVYEVQPFKGISNASSADIHYIKSDTFEVKVTAPEKLLEEMTVKVEDGTLSISQHDNFVHSNGIPINGKSIAVWVKAPSIESVMLLGSGDFYSKDTLRASTFQFSTNGSGDISVATISNAAKVDVQTLGSGDVSIVVDKCGDITGKSVGSGDLGVVGTARSCNLKALGSGDVVNATKKWEK